MTAVALEPALLLSSLEADGFTLREDGGKLLVTPASKLAPGQREDIRRWRDDLLALIAERADAGKVLAALDGRKEVQGALWITGNPDGPFRLRA